MLLGEFRSYGDADRAIRSWQAEHHGPESCDGQGVSYVSPMLEISRIPFQSSREGVPSVLGARSPRRHPDGRCPAWSPSAFVIRAERTVNGSTLPGCLWRRFHLTSSEAKS